MLKVEGKKEPFVALGSNRRWHSLSATWMSLRFWGDGWTPDESHIPHGWCWGFGVTSCHCAQVHFALAEGSPFCSLDEEPYYSWCFIGLELVLTMCYFSGVGIFARQRLRVSGHGCGIHTNITEAMVWWTKVELVEVVFVWSGGGELSAAIDCTRSHLPPSPLPGLRALFQTSCLWH